DLRTPRRTQKLCGVGGRGRRQLRQGVMAPNVRRSSLFAPYLLLDCSGVMRPRSVRPTSVWSDGAEVGRPPDERCQEGGPHAVRLPTCSSGPVRLSSPPTPHRHAVSPADHRAGRRCPMPIALTCPKCRVPQTVPDEAAGGAVGSPSARAEFPAEPAPPAPNLPKRRVRWLVIGLVLAGAGVLVGAGLSAYLLINRPIPTDFTDPNGIFSARFPNRPEAETVSQAEPQKLLWGQQLYRA